MGILDFFPSEFLHIETQIKDTHMWLAILFKLKYSLTGQTCVRIGILLLLASPVDRYFLVEHFCGHWGWMLRLHTHHSVWNVVVVGNSLRYEQPTTNTTNIWTIEQQQQKCITKIAMTENCPINWSVNINTEI